MSISDHQIFKFLTSRQFLIQLGLMFLCVVVVIFGVLFWLKLYTNHGQKLELPNYIDQQVDDAIKDAKKKSFMIIVNDSIHKINVPGGRILNQNPKGSSIVKENRKIYVTVSKYNADMILTDNLPPIIYGKNYDRVKNQLENLEIFAKIKDYKYDNAAPNSILEVWYDGQQIVSNNGTKEGVEIAKGGTLEYVLSQSSGGEVNVPDVTCSQLSTAKFTIEASRLMVAEIIEQGEITNPEQAYIVKQIPAYGENTTMRMGEGLTLYITQHRPPDCN